MQMIRVILFLVAFPVSNVLFGQPPADTVPDSLRRHYYLPVFPKLSPNERYVAFNKSYDYASDTVVIVDRQNPDATMFEKGGVPAYTVQFTAGNMLLMRSGKNAQLMHLPSGKIREWKNVSASFYHNVLRQIFILQNGTLHILDETGNSLRSFQGVTGIKDDKTTVNYTVKNGEMFTLTEWNGRKPDALHTAQSSDLEILYRDPDGMLVMEQGSSAKKEVVFRKDSIADPLSKWHHGAIAGIRVSKFGKDMYFLHIYGELPRNDPGLPDLWYGNDRKVSTKFYGDYVGRFFLWSPLASKFAEISDHKLTHLANIEHSRYLLAFDPFYAHDYTKKFKTFNVHRYDTQEKKYEFVMNSGSTVNTDEGGRHLLTYHKEGWELYSTDTAEHRHIPVAEHENAYFAEDGKNILFEGTGKLYKYEIATGALSIIPTKAGFRARIRNGIMTRLAGEFEISRQTYSLKQPLIIELYDRDMIRNAWVSYDGRTVKTIIGPTGDDVTEVNWDERQHNFLYVTSNINRTPELTVAKGNRHTAVYKSNKTDNETAGIKSETINYKNSNGVDLQGLLIYPIGFENGKKYPMVVTVYQKLRYNKNKYLIDGTGMVSPTEGINIRTLLRKGYMVYLPDIVFDERGTGRAALDCVDKAMDALQGNVAVDFGRVALVGHSHGGYETNFIATQSGRFATYVSGAGNSDLVRSYHSFNYDFKRPFFWQFEDGQYEMPGPFTENKALYADNSPIYHAEKVSSPMLLWTGMKDYNIFWEQTMEFYMGLRRSYKPVIAIFYPDDGHSFLKTKNRTDLYSRIYEWLDYHLKNRKSAWIEKMYNK
jgi:dienelactone hydrolase